MLVALRIKLSSLPRASVSAWTLLGNCQVIGMAFFFLALLDSATSSIARYTVKSCVTLFSYSCRFLLSVAGSRQPDQNFHRHRQSVLIQKNRRRQVAMGLP